MFAQQPLSCKKAKKERMGAAMSEAAEAEACEEVIEADCEVVPSGTLERVAAMQRIKMAFMSGQGSLAALAVKERVPYQTVLRASSDEKWSIQKKDVLQKTDTKVAESVADWVAEQRTLQIKTALKRARRMQKAIDQSLGEEDAVLLPAELQALASAEERMDNIARRNLGMDGQTQQSAAVSINILAGGIQLS